MKQKPAHQLTSSPAHQLTSSPELLIMIHSPFQAIRIGNF